MSMLDVEADELKGPRTVMVHDIPLGTVFFANLGQGRGVFLRFVHGVLRLNKPIDAWTGNDELKIENYQPARSARLIVR